MDGQYPQQQGLEKALLQMLGLRSLNVSHYRFFGLEDLEQDRDAIQGAVDRVMGHLRTFSTGKHSDLSQQLLNEAARRSVILLNPEKKRAYDATLTPTQEVELEMLGPELNLTDAPSVRSSYRPPRKSNSSQGVMIGVAGVAVLLLGAVLYLATSGSDPAPNEPKVAQQKEEPDLVLPVAPAPPEEPEPRPNPWAVRRPSGLDLPEPRPSRPTRPVRPNPFEQPTEEPKEPKVSWKETLAAAQRKVRQDFQFDSRCENCEAIGDWLDYVIELESARKSYARSTNASPDDKAYLQALDELIAQCYTGAIVAAAASGDLKSAQTTLDAFGEKLNAVQAQTALLQGISRIGRQDDGSYSPDAVEPILWNEFSDAASQALEIGQDHWSSGNFDSTWQLAQVAQQLLQQYEVRRKIGKPEYSIETDRFSRHLREMRESAQKMQANAEDIRQAHRQFQQQPEDPQANLKLAEYYREQGLWQQSLEHYQHTQDLRYAKVAQAHLEADPKQATPSQCEALANQLLKVGIKPLAADWLVRGEHQLSGIERRQYTLRNNLNDLRDLSSLPFAQRDPVEEALENGQAANLLELRREYKIYEGKLEHNENGIVCENSKTLLALPITLGEKTSYEIRCRFTRLEGDDGIALTLPMGSQSCTAIYSGWDGRYSGLSDINGFDGSRYEPSERGILENNREYEARVKVTYVPGEDEVRVVFGLDGQWSLIYSLRPDSLAPTEKFRIPNPRCIGLGCGGATIFHRLELKINDGDFETIKLE